MKKYKSDEEVLNIVRRFENCEFGREEWRHADHLIVGLYYVLDNNAEIAIIKMRDGIFKLLNSFGVDLSKEMPYHETLTFFWIRQIDDFAKSKDGFSIAEIANEMIERFDKDHPLRYYSRELLFSDEARKNFVKGDVDPLL
jgi:hypothetical protein